MAMHSSSARVTQSCILCQLSLHLTEILHKQLQHGASTTAHQARTTNDCRTNCNRFLIFVISDQLQKTIDTITSRNSFHCAMWSTLYMIYCSFFPPPIRLQKSMDLLNLNLECFWT